MLNEGFRQPSTSTLTIKPTTAFQKQHKLFSQKQNNNINTTAHQKQQHKLFT